MLGIVLARSPSFLGALTCYGRDLFDLAARRRLETLMPHFVRAMALRNRVSWLSRRAAAFEAGMERLPVGAMLIGPGGEVVHCNARARAIFDRDDGLRIAGEQVLCKEPQIQGKLDEALAQARHARSEIEAPILVSRASGRRPYQILISRSQAEADGREWLGALVWIHDPEDTSTQSAAALEQILGLTQTEARLTAALARGVSVRGYAEAAGVRESTARRTLKQVLAKTNARSQADLIRLVLGSIPVVS